MAKERVEQQSKTPSSPVNKLFIPDSVVPGERAEPIDFNDFPTVQLTDGSNRGSARNLARIYGLNYSLSFNNTRPPSYIQQLVADVQREVTQAVGETEDEHYIEAIFNSIMTRGQVLVNRYRQSVYDLVILNHALGTLDTHVGQLATRIEERRRKRIKVQNSKAYGAFARALKSAIIEAKPAEASLLFRFLADPQAQLLPFLVTGDYRFGEYDLVQAHFIFTECFEPRTLAERGKGKWAIITIVQTIPSADQIMQVSVNRADLSNRLESQHITHISPDWCLLKVVKIIGENENAQEVLHAQHSTVETRFRQATTGEFRSDQSGSLTLDTFMQSVATRGNPQQPR